MCGREREWVVEGRQKGRKAVAGYWPYNFKGAMEIKYNFGSLKTLLCPNNNDTNFIAYFKQLI